MSETSKLDKDQAQMVSTQNVAIQEPNGNTIDNTNQSDETRSNLSDMSRDDDGDQIGIKFQDWGFKVDRLFEVAYRFYKRYESKAFQLSFEVRNEMNALISQARFGNFDYEKNPDIGILDLVGKNRRHQWSLLSGMSKTEAMTKFICNLDQICPLFKAYAEAVKISSDQQYKEHQLNYTNQSMQSQPNGIGHNNNVALGSLSLLETDEQLKAIHTSLCKQTYSQFKSYAEKQYPDDGLKQKYLVATLQEQYYQQYISQLHPEMNSRQSSGKQSSSVSPSVSIERGNESTEVSNSPQNHTENDLSSPAPTVLPPSQQVQAQQAQQALQQSHEYDPDRYQQEPVQQQTTTSLKISTPTQNLNPEINHPEFDLGHGTTSHLAILESDQQQESNITNNNNSDIKLVDTWDRASSSDAGSPLDQSINYEPLEPASIWTKQGTQEFKASLMDDKQGGSYVVNQGVLLTIQVPTYPDGRYIYWEFVTDDYDIGFGLDFVYDAKLSEPLAIKISEDSDDGELGEDEDEEDYANDDAVLNELALNELNIRDRNQDPTWPSQPILDVELAQSIDRQRIMSTCGGSANNPMPIVNLSARRAAKLARLSNTVSVLPTYRRDSHEEIFVGRHKYPGQGYYVLKFDNTYSVLRSKCIHFRICYFI